MARDTFTTADNVVLASAAPGNFPDALTANYLAGVGAGPVLLTAPASLPQATLDALSALRAARVFIIGGEAAVSAGVEAQLRAAGYTVERLGGADRYATAELVVKRVGGLAVNIGVLDGRRTAILGNGQDFPDILAAGPLSYSEQFPLTITRPAALPSDTRDVLRDLDIQQVIVVGGTRAVSAAVEAELAALGITVIRLQGADRFGTAVAIADYGYDKLAYDVTHVDLARSDDFADALAGGPHAGRQRAPIVLTPPTALNETTRAFLERRSPTLTEGHIFGGVSAVSEAVASAAQVAATGTAPIEVTLASSTVEAGAALTGTITGDGIEAVTVSGCGLTAEPLGADTDPAVAGRQFRLQTPANQPAGPCTLTFTITVTGGAAVTRTVGVSITAPTAPTVTAQATAPAVGATAVTFTANEPLLPASVTTDDVTVTGGDTQASVTDVSLSVSGDVITVTTTPLVEGNVVTLAANSVSALDGTTGPATAVATPAAAPVSEPNTVALWHMEDTDRTMVDAVGGDQNGTVSSNVQLGQPGFVGDGYGFVELPSYVTVPTAPELNPGSADFSVTAYVQFSTLPAGGPVNGQDENTYDIIRKGLSTTAGGDWKLEIMATGEAHCVFIGATGQGSVKGGGNLADGKWHRITCSRTASAVTLTVDRVLVATQQVATGTIDNSDPVLLGVKNTAGDDQYVGLLDEVSIAKG